MKLGARTIKTGLTITLTILLVGILETRIDTVQHDIVRMATITAIVGMKPSIKGSLETLRNRVIATFIGTLVALPLILTLGSNAFCLGLGGIAIILICLKLQLDESIRFALITLVAVGVYHGDFEIMGVVYRVSGILIGLTVSTGLNITFMPPDYTKDLKAKMNDLRIKFERLYENVISDLLREENIAKETIKDKKQLMRDELDETRDIYSLLIGDVSPKTRKRLKKYRRSINAIQFNLERLMALHRGIVFMPSGSQYCGLRQDLYQYLQYLLDRHKQLYAYITLNEDCQKVEESIDTEEIRRKIVRLIRTDSDEDIFEFYNVYFEATRINEKLEQLKDEFENATDHPLESVDTKINPAHWF